MTKCAVLVVDDDDSVVELTSAILRKHCTSIDVATDGANAAEMLRSGAYDVVVLDLMLPKMNGFEVAKMMSDLPKQPKMIVLSAVSRYFEDRFPPDTIVLQKPFDIDHLGEAMTELQAR